MTATCIDIPLGGETCIFIIDNIMSWGCDKYKKEGCYEWLIQTKPDGLCLATVLGNTFPCLYGFYGVVMHAEKLKGRISKTPSLVVLNNNICTSSFNGWCHVFLAKISLVV